MERNPVAEESLRVYLVRPYQFHAKDAADAQGSLATVRVYKDSPAAGWTVVVVYTGPGLQLFLRPPVAPS